MIIMIFKVHLLSTYSFSDSFFFFFSTYYVLGPSVVIENRTVPAE